MLRIILVFIAGLLVGANAVYYAMTRDRPPVDRSQAPMPDAAVVDATPPSAASTPGQLLTDTHPTDTPTTMPPAATTAPLPTSVATLPTGSTLAMPVSGVRPGQLNDTFNDARGTSRVHEALDIMAPRGTPVVAANDGKVAKLFTSDQGGLTVYQFDPASTVAYYYAHLDSYAPGLVEGQRLRRGDLVGHVGSTGNASPDAPHLHFAIFQLGPEKNWWKGTPINPYPLLTGKPAAPAPVAPSPTTKATVTNTSSQ